MQICLSISPMMLGLEIHLLRINTMLTTVQSIEWGRPLLRIVLHGCFFVVEPHGVIKYETKPFEELARVEELRLGKVETIYRKRRMDFSLKAWIGISLYTVFGRREKYEKDSDEKKETKKTKKKKTKKSQTTIPLLRTKFDLKNQFTKISMVASKYIGI